MTEGTSMQNFKVRVQRSRSQRSNDLLNRFWTANSGWFHIWWWTAEQSLMLLRRGALFVFQGHPSNFKVTWLKNRRFLPKLGVSWLYLQFKFINGYQMMHKCWSSIEEVPYCFAGYLLNFKVTREKMDFHPNWAFSVCNSSFNLQMAMKWCAKL